MKAILNLSITCMVAAGLYGFADFASDLNDGTLIRYEEGSNSTKLKELSNNKNKRSKLAVALNGKKEQAENNTPNEDESTIDPDKLQMKYFSRGAPVFSEEELIIEDSTETAAAEQSAQALSTTVEQH